MLIPDAATLGFKRVFKAYATKKRDQPCLVNSKDESVLVIGGSIRSNFLDNKPLTTVSRYDLTSDTWVDDLPQLNVGRS